MTTPTTVQVRLQIRADTAANWTSVNPVLLDNELGLETDTKKFKIGDGNTSWQSLAYFPSIVSGGTVLGNLEIGTTGTLTFEGSTANGFETTLGVVDPTADRTILLPNQSGTVVVGGNASIVDADIAANAEIAVSKLADGAARQLLQTDAAGTGVEWTSNIDIPGTLDVTGAATFDGAVTVAGDLTVNGTTTTISTQNLLVEDKNIILGDVATPTDVTADGGGITLKGATDKTISWIDSTDAWTSSERFSVPLGSAAAPSLTFTGDPNTGIYSPGADQVAISTGGSGRLFVSQNRTGVNINPTAFQLQVNENSGAASYVHITNSDTGTTGSDGALIGLDSDEHLIVWNQEAKDLRLATSGQERARIDSSGRLLVGTSTSTTGVAFASQIQSNAFYAYSASLFSADNIGSHTWFLKSRNATVNQHTAVQSGDVLGRINFAGSDGDEFIHAALIQAVVDNGAVGTAVSNNECPAALVLSTTADGASSPTERLRITSAGNVGIGTTSPARLFDCAGIARIGAADTSDATLEIGAGATGNRTAYIDFVSDTTYTDYGLRVAKNPGANGLSYLDCRGTGGLLLSTTEAAPISFNTSNTERARIDSSGRLLVGTSSISTNNAIVAVQGRSDSSTAGGKLLIAKGPGDPVDGGSLGSLLFSGNNYSDSATIGANRDGGTWTAGSSQPSRLVFSTTADGASSPTERMRLDSSGRLLLGATATESFFDGALNVAGRIHQKTAGAMTIWHQAASGTRSLVEFGTGTTYTAVGSINTTGTSTAYNTTSDYRLKENVTAVTDGINRLQQLKPSRFNFIADPTKTVDGFIAHEVQAVIPEAITGEKDAVDAEGNPVYQGIDQSKLVPLLTAALQEAVAKIESLEARLTAAGI